MELLARLSEFIVSFHNADGLDNKLKVLGDFFSFLGVQQAFFISTVELCRKRVLPILYTDEKDVAASIDKMLGKQEDASFWVEGIFDKEFTVFPIKDDEKNYGKLYFYPYIQEQADVYRIVKEVTICGIKGCELKELFLNKTKQFETFRKLSNQVSSYYSLNDLLKMLVESVTDALNTNGAVIRLVDREKELLEVKAEFGLHDVHIRRYGIPKGDGVSGEVWATGKSKLVLPDTQESINLLKSKLNVSSLICVPLTFENEIIGTLSVYEKLGERTFTEDDKNFLEALGSLLAPVIAYTATIEREKQLLSKLEKHLKNLSLITEINKILMQPRKLDNLLYILLTTLTFGEEIGFNRAVLFMYNSKTGTLQGMMGIGCESVEEAYQAWQSLPKDVSAIKWIEKLTEMESFSDNTFGQKVKALRFFLDEVNSFATAYRTSQVYLEENPDDILAKIFGVNEYAIVPLFGREELLGMLYVDNKFTTKKIDEDYIKLLETFASQASIAIENTKIFNEIKESNEMLKAAKQELLIKEKLAIVGEMLTTLAHEVRNPLTAMGGFAKLINKRSDDETIKSLSQKILSQAERVNNMFNDFLYLTKTNEYHTATCNLIQVINNSINNLSFLFTDKIALKVDVASDIPCIPIDESVLGVVIDNLIKNAVQAMPDGGTITIKSYQYEEEVYIIVEDEGHGIAPNVLPHIFDPFYTTKFNGVGVGLSVSYKIIKQYSGTIYAENRSNGKGARFVIKFPCKYSDVDEKRNKKEGVL